MQSLKKKNKKKNGQKCWNTPIETFATLVVSMVISPLPGIVGKIKTDAVSSKFCLVSPGVILFLVSVKLFE